MSIEAESKSKSYSYPLSEAQLQKLNAGDTVRSFPAAQILRRLLDRIPEETVVERNAYGETGGDLVQHGNTRAMDLAVQGELITLRIKKNNPDRQTITAEVTMPTFGDTENAKKLWYGKPTRNVVLSWDELKEGVVRQTMCKIVSTVMDTFRGEHNS